MRCSRDRPSRSSLVTTSWSAHPYYPAEKQRFQPFLQFTVGGVSLGCLGSRSAGLDGGVVRVATRDVFSAEELARLRGFPEITRAELIRYFTLTGPDVAFLRKFHGTGNVLGAGVQLCSLPWLGFVPDDVGVQPR